MVTAWRPVATMAPRGEDRPRWPPLLPAPCDACRQPTGSPRQRLPPSSRAEPRTTSTVPCLLPCLASAQAPARLPLARAAGRTSAARARAYPRRLPQGLTRAAPAGAHTLLPHPPTTHGIGHDAVRNTYSYVVVLAMHGAAVTVIIIILYKYEKLKIKKSLTSGDIRRVRAALRLRGAAPF